VGAPLSVQSMTTTVTANLDATLQQIAEPTAAACQIVRVMGCVVNGLGESREADLGVFG
jgi:4-hydroxy-3-methylbut-2-en-1-yl diphosphate synthase IspG/GcpE